MLATTRHGLAFDDYALRARWAAGQIAWGTNFPDHFCFRFAKLGYGRLVVYSHVGRDCLFLVPGPENGTPDNAGECFVMRQYDAPKVVNLGLSSFVRPEQHAN